MYAFCVVIVYSVRRCVLFNVLLVYCLLFVYLVVYVTYIVLTLPPGGQPICSSVIIIVIIIIIIIIIIVTSNRRTLRGSVASYGYVPSSPILVTLMMEALLFSETSVLTRATRRNIPEDVIPQVYYF
jgi:hypothetical protein